MIVLMNEELKTLYETGKSREYRDVERNPELSRGFVRAVKILTIVRSCQELKGYSFLHYEQLKYEWAGYSSVRLSNRYVHRLIFREDENRLEIQVITINDSHYGNKK